MSELSTFGEILDSGSREMDVALEIGQIDRLIGYLELLEKWNKTHNLTAVRNIRDMLGRHLLDSLSVSKLVCCAIDTDHRPPKTLLDVGSGGGLPGIPLAIVNPHLTVTLVDSVEKKTRFLEFAIGQLKLRNISVVHSQVQNLRAPTFERIVARAFAAPEKFLSLSGHLLAKGGQVHAMTASTSLEIGDQIAGFRVLQVKNLTVPGETAERNIVIFGRAL